ncbi:hypothetical protein LTR17_010097 [Elasticomyces elasticus]|nr:hypothetical protein LTR17_010097 [Elasticomyces elasticus]
MSSSPEAGALTSAERPQYHHHIPKLILCGFVSAVQPLPVPAGSSIFSSKQRKKPQRRNEQLNLISLHDGSLVQGLMACQYGLTDMHRDYRAPQQHALEVKLATLEQKAGEIYAKARAAFGVPGTTFTLSRTEKTDLRKFLLPMKYRGHSMYSRFNVSTIAEYTGGDRDKLRSYMAAKGLETPRDVWVANLYAFLDAKIDAGHLWHQVIRQQAYEENADLFIYHVGASYMAFCKPQSASDEWLLTENVYSILEGPSTGATEPVTGEPSQVYTEWHNFAPVSASLLIVLWSNFLAWRHGQAWNGVAAKDIPRQSQSTCESRGCHVSAARCTNCSVLQCLTSYSPHDRFTFRCFELAPAHVNRINGLFLEEGLGTYGTAYKSGTAAAKAIKLYLEDTTRGLKSLEKPNSRRTQYLVTLEKALQALGGTAGIMLPARIISTRDR